MVHLILDILLINLIRIEDFDLSYIVGYLLIYQSISVTYFVLSIAITDDKVYTNVTDILDTYISHTKYMNDILDIRYIINKSYYNSRF